MSDSTLEKKARSKNDHRIWRIVIGGIVTVATTLIIKSDANSSYCTETKKEAARCIVKIDQWLLKPLDDETKMNLVYWKEYCQSVLRYKCSEIHTNADEITKALYTTKRQIELCEKS